MFILIFFLLLFADIMIIFDMFFIVIYNFFSKLRKETAKNTALSYLTLWLSFLLVAISNIFGLWRNNKVSYYIVNNFFVSSIMIGICLVLFFGIRYYKLYDVEHFQKIFYQKSKLIRTLYYCLVPLIIALSFVLFFCVFRLYKFGHI